MKILDVLKANKKIAIIIILVLVLILYLKFSRREKAKAGKNDRKKGKGGRKGRRERKTARSGKPGKPGKRRGDDSDEEDPKERASVQRSNRDDDDSDSDSSSDEDQDLREDADELYNLVHEGMCSGMQQAEFDEAVGDLANAFVFIELKQMYNQCIDKNMDPERSITVNDYIRILKKE